MTIDELVSRLAGRLAGVPGVRFAVLFGSTILRGPDQARDIDVAVAFDRPMSWFELAGIAVAIETELGREMDLVDLDEASTLLRWEVLQAGRLVLARDRDGWLDFQARVPIEMADLRLFMDRESEGLRRALRGTPWSESTS